MNGLKYFRHEEENVVATFVRSIRVATDAFQKDPLWSPLIPNWNRVESALPTFLDDLREAVRRDNDLVEPIVTFGPPPLRTATGGRRPTGGADSYFMTRRRRKSEWTTRPYD